MSGTGGGGSGHILVVPFPAQGHLLPLLNLTHRLLPHGFAITVLLTPNTLTSLDLLPPSVTPLLLPFPSHPLLPAGVENTQQLPPGVYNTAVMNAHARLRAPLLAWFRSHPSPPAAILSDFFTGWTQLVAAELAIPRFVFYASGAFAVSVFDWLFNHVNAKLELNAVVNMPDFPGSPSFSYRELPSLFRRCIASDELGDIRDGMIANKSSYGAVFNTMSALEHRYLAHVRSTAGHSRVWAVSPLFPTGSRPEPEPSRVLRWLDGCPDGSVVYVCFGSQATLSAYQEAALGSGMERSGARFVWVVKGSNEPARSEEVAEGRGVVFRGWAPQVAILNHRAVGVFVTHCGWNSVLEGVAARVRLLAWPREADQFVNARLLVEELGLAVRVCEGADAVPEVDELARVVADAVREEGRAEWSRVAKMAAAVAHDGSSAPEWAGFVEELKAVCLFPYQNKIK